MTKKMIVLIFVNVLLLLSFAVLLCVLLLQKNDPEPEAFYDGSNFSSQSWVLELERQYETSMSQATSNLEKENVNIQYAERWYQYAEEYYDLIMEHAPEILKESFVTMDDWKHYAELTCREYAACLEIHYAGGTAAAHGAAKYEYELYRQRALELYEIYTDIVDYNAMKDIQTDSRN